MGKKSANKASEEIKDAIWKNAESGNNMFGEIKFRKNNKKNYFRSFLKVICFILVAALSGGITAQYAINKGKKPIDVSGETKSSILGANVQGLFENSISQVVQKVLPAVVGISNKQEELWGTPEGSASGVIYKSDGFIITNYHVIEGSTEIKVKLSNDNVLKATVIGSDAVSDLAVIKVEANNLPVAKFGDSSKLRLGDIAVAVGNPLGEQFSGNVTAGVISSLDRRINIVNKTTGEQTIYKLIQTDADINSGNSGGALCNIYGEVIGINSFKINSIIGSETAGFAISTNEAKDIVNELITYGKVIRPAIGIYGGTAISVGNDAVEGVYVQDVIRESGADKAGIRPTDIIIEIGGEKVKNMEELSNVLGKYKVGGILSCKLWRDGKVKEISIVLSELKAN